MSETQEYTQLNRVLEVSKKLDSNVWSQDAFPAEERPDLEYLLPRIAIDDNPTFSIESHPEVKALRNTIYWDELLHDGKAETEEDHQVFQEKKLVNYNQVTRSIEFSPAVLSFSEARLKGFVAFHLGLDNYARNYFIPYDQLPDDFKDTINQTLTELRSMGAQLYGEVEVAQSGTRMGLLIDITSSWNLCTCKWFSKI